MGYARILSGGPTGRYTIELDFGSAQKAAFLAALATQVANLDIRIAQSQLANDEADALEAAAAADILASTEALIAAQTLPPGSPATDPTGFQQATAFLAQIKVQHAPLRLQLAALKHEKSIAVGRVAYWNNFFPIVQKQAWCVDLTEDAPVDSYPATVDIPGESDLTLLVPGCRAWNPTDGIFKGREIMSPEQAFLNAAILPGWQKFKPTYRWGTCTAIDEDAQTMSVSLASAVSSARGLNVNQATTLENVPVTYLDCNCSAFEVGDRVVVQFDGQNWASPRVIGFLDNPRPCKGWKFAASNIVQNGVGGTPRFLLVVFESIWTDAEFYARTGAATSVAMDLRINRGDWQTTLSLAAAYDPSNLVIWNQTPAGMSVSLYPPGFALGDDGTLVGSPGAFNTPAYFRIALFIDSGWSPLSPLQPYYPLDSTLEVRLRLDGEVFVNVALRLGFPPPYDVKGDTTVPASLSPTVEQLDYVRFSDDGT